MSYTTFAYSDLRVQAVHQNDADSAALESAWARDEASPKVEGGSTAIWLHRPVFEVSFWVSNTGNVEGGEVRFRSLPFCLQGCSADRDRRSRNCTYTSPREQANPRVSFVDSQTSCSNRERARL